MKFHRLAAAGLGLFAALLAGPTSADSVQIDGRYGSIVISDRERAQIRDYYQAHPVTAPAGKKLNKGMQKRLAKGKALPPGWQKNIARGEVMPEAVWTQRQTVPPAVITRLPPQPEGVITVRVDSKIVRVVAATQVILDAFDL